MKPRLQPELGGTLCEVLSLAVIDAVATLEGVDPLEFADEVGVTLRDSIDPKALDAVVGDGSGTGDVFVEFVFLEYRIQVDDAGRIRVFDRE
jgi:hypothetical protein